MELLALSDRELLDYEQSLIKKKFSEYVRLKTLLNDKVLGEVINGADVRQPLAEYLPKRLGQVTATIKVYYSIVSTLLDVAEEWERRADAVKLA